MRRVPRILRFLPLLVCLASPAFAQVKISGLPAATVPLAGNELVPIVQGGVTKNVATGAIGNAGTALSGVTLSGTTVFSGPVTATGQTITGGTLSGATLTGGTLSGTTTLPGSGAISSGGLIGIGMSPTNPLDITKSGNAVELAAILNSNAGAAAAAAFSATNGTNQGNFGQTGASFTPGGAYLADQTFVEGHGAGGILLNTTAAHPVIIGINSTETARFATAGGLTLGGYIGSGALSNGEMYASVSSTGGAKFQGKGSTDDLEWLNAAGTLVMNVPTGTTNLSVVGFVGAGGYVGGAYSNGNAALGGDATAGATVEGAGSSYDVSLVNKSGATALRVLTGTTNVGVVGNLTVGGNLTVTGTSTLPGTVFTGTPIAVPAGGATGTFAHGLAALPKFVTVLVKETDAGGDCGYTQNQYVVLPSTLGSAINQTTAYDTTNVYVVIGNTGVIDILNASTGATCTITNAKWNLTANASLL